MEDLSVRLQRDLVPGGDPLRVCEAGVLRRNRGVVVVVMMLVWSVLESYPVKECRDLPFHTRLGVGHVRLVREEMGEVFEVAHSPEGGNVVLLRYRRVRMMMRIVVAANGRDLIEDRLEVFSVNRVRRIVRGPAGMVRGRPTVLITSGVFEHLMKINVRVSRGKN